MWEREGKTAALGTQTCYQSIDVGFASILETQPAALLQGCLFLVRKLGVEYVGSA